MFSIISARASWSYCDELGHHTKFWSRLRRAVVYSLILVLLSWGGDSIGAQNPLEVELGFTKGLSDLSLCPSRPQRLILGLQACILLASSSLFTFQKSCHWFFSLVLARLGRWLESWGIWVTSLIRLPVARIWTLMCFIDFVNIVYNAFLFLLAFLLPESST